MSLSDAILKSYYDALSGNISVPVYSSVPDDVAEFIHIGFDISANEGTKTEKLFTSRLEISAHVTNDNYGVSRKRAFDLLAEVEAEIWPTVGAVVDMTDNDYQMISQNIVEISADDTLYSIARVVRAYMILEFTVEPI